MVSCWADARAGRHAAAARRSRALAGLSGLTRLSALAVFLVAGCVATNDDLSGQVGRVDRTIGDARAESVLANIARASLHHPLNFTAVTAVHGSNALTGTVGIPSVTLGPTGGAPRNYVIGPNSVGTTNSTAFDQSVLQTAEFYKGLLTPVSLVTLNTFVAQGYPREVAFYLFVDRLRVREAGRWTEYSSDPLAPSFPVFRKYLNTAIDRGLTTEIVTVTREEARLKEPLTLDNYMKIADAKLQTRVDPRTGETVVENSHPVAQLCFDPLLARQPLPPDLHPLCGATLHGKAANRIALSVDQGDFEIEVVARSTYSIFSYLGHLVEAGDRGRVVLQSEDARIGDDALLLDVSAATKDCAVKTSYQERSYCVPRNAPSTMRTISALIELTVLNTSVNDLPATATIRITP
jgi:hypothetical protein